MADQSDTPQSMSKQPDDPRSEEELAANIARKHPFELEEQIETLDKPLIVECACPGWQPRMWPQPDAYPRRPPNYEAGGTRYPAVPCTIDEQADEIVSAVEAGCAASHIHPRDPTDCFASHEVSLLADVYDRIFEQTDVVPIQHSWERTEDGYDYISPAQARIDAAGGSTKYVECALVLWPPANSYREHYADDVQAGLEFYQNRGIKPINKVRGWYDMNKFYEDAIATGVLEDDNPVVILEMGHPYGWPMNSEGWMDEMTSALSYARDRFPDDAVIGVYSGQRNWMPVTMAAVLNGVDIVRVGIEDAYWMYPHRDEVIPSNLACIRKITEFATSVGRELATPEQARELLGIAG